MKGRDYRGNTCSKCGEIIPDKLKKKYCQLCANAYQREWRKQNPLTEEQKFKAIVRSKTKMRIRRGLLIPYPCEVCSENKVEAHHPDYNKPYDVRWLCFKHHREFHKQQRLNEQQNFKENAGDGE